MNKRTLIDTDNLMQHHLVKICNLIFKLDNNPLAYLVMYIFFFREIHGHPLNLSINFI